eukprot:TRINITY_DN107089_c0_g1_i1.p1 TRINITY_DN107089_c0_g1~~TRINITY_DN107089_c0_g1_i1.p1  ORF type:complete len:281 (-),score=14.73 TRINITY_DN107089_c0_g1_i1:9-851(-)
MVSETALMMPIAPRPLTARSASSTNSSCTSTSFSGSRGGNRPVQSPGVLARSSRSHSLSEFTASRSLRPGASNAKVPGYAGHVPGAKVENIIGARFAEVNAIAAFGDPKRSPRRDGHTSSRSQGYHDTIRPESARCRYVPGYTGWVQSKRTQPDIIGMGFTATNHAADVRRAALSARDHRRKSGSMHNSLSEPCLGNVRSLKSSRASSACPTQSSSRSSANNVPRSKRAGERTQNELTPSKSKSNGLHRFFKNEFARVCTSSFRPAYSPPDFTCRPEWRN